MKFSLVTTCLNEIESLGKWRRDLERQTRQPDEVVIVDALSTDGTAEALEAWARDDGRVKVRFEKCSCARGRNIAIDMAQHERVISTDLGVRLDRRWIEEMARPFEDDPSVEVVMGSYAVDLDTVRTAAARAEFYIEGNNRPFMIDSSGKIVLRAGVVPSNRSVAYLRRVWRELGGLPEDLTRCADDSVFGRQLLQCGYKIGFAPDAMVFWSRHRTLGQFWREQRVYGRGDGEAAIKTPAPFRWYRQGLLPAWLVPPLVGLRTFMKQMKVRRIVRALRDGDLAACVYMPLLSFGNGFSLGKGYLEGFEYGNEHCHECRRRLTVERHVL